LEFYDAQHIERQLLASPFKTKPLATPHVKFLGEQTPMKSRNVEEFLSPSVYQETFMNQGSLDLKTPHKTFTEEDILKTLDKGKKKKDYFAGGMWHQAPDASNLPIPKFE
jgi:hypothetical protein